MTGARDAAVGLHAVIDDRLFGEGARCWGDAGANSRCSDTIDELADAAVLPSDLVCVFTGLWSPDQIVGALEVFGLITATEKAALFEQLADCEDLEDADFVLLPVVRQAYESYFNPRRLLV